MQTLLAVAGKRPKKGSGVCTFKKYLDVEGDNNFHTRLEGEEGELCVPVENVVTIDVVVLTSRSTDSEFKGALGEAEWNSMPRKQARKIKRGPNSYLPAPERERIWLDCPH